MNVPGTAMWAAASERAAAQPAKILLVDDLEANLTALKKLLSGDGVDVIEASSGRAALELLLVHEFALAIIDVQMPGMNGFELASLMRGTERTRRIPIVFVTAGAHNEQHRFRGYESGAVDFLFKPIEPDILRYKAAVFLELYRSRQEIARQRDELHASEARLSEELRLARLLQDLSTELIQAERQESIYSLIAVTLASAMGADCSCVHTLHQESERRPQLRLLAHHGLTPETVRVWSHVDLESDAPCCVALATRKRFTTSNMGSQAFDSTLRVIQSTPLHSRDGRPLGTISTGWRQAYQPSESQFRALDIVARQAADLIERTGAVARLQQAKERFRFMAESMPQQIFTATAKGDVDYLNRKWTEFTGRTLVDLAVQGWAQCLHPEDRETYLQRWRDCVNTGAPFEMEHRLRRHDAVYRWHLTRAHAMRNADGAVSMWIGSSTDIHSQKETEADLRRLNEDLKQFAFAAGHDLQEPLRMIRCYSELLLRSCGDQAGQNAELFTRYIKQGTGRMQELLADLLSYMHLTQADTEEAGETELQVALNIALENLDAALRESGATVECEQLPVIRGTETQWVQVFQNLVANAIKYRGAEPPHIRVQAEHRNDAWRISIGDNGIGIAPEYHEQIFGLFKRLHGKEIPGTGIGLSICKRIVERRGGRIWVESEQGAGSTFVMDLPR